MNFIFNLKSCIPPLPPFTGTSYNNMMKKVSVVMDQSLNEEVSRQLLEESPMDTKSDLIIESAEEGTLSLLKKWPDMKEKLQVCLNQPLPTQLRQVAWRLYLSDTKGRKIIGFKSDCLMSFYCLSI